MSFLIAIGAGHYAGNKIKKIPKALDPNQTLEWTLNCRVADRLGELLAAYDCQTMRVDDPSGAGVPLQDRINRANTAKANVAISIHHNAAGQIFDGGGITVFCRKSATAEEQKLQEAVYRHLILLTNMRGNRANPMPKKNYDALTRTKMTAVLCELGFMDSRKDAPAILAPGHADLCARGIVNALVEVYGLKKKEDYIDMTREDVEKLVANTVAQQMKEFTAQVSDAVRTAMENGLAAVKQEVMGEVYQTVEECPAWAREAVRWAVANGGLKGDHEGRLQLNAAKLWGAQFAFNMINHKGG